MNETRRSLHELATRYELHPDLYDVFVEGDSDRGLVKWFLRTHQHTAAVYPISQVEIPAELLLKSGLDDNNRSRVVFVAEYLEKEVSPALRVLCIADADFDRFLGTSPASEFLLLTDYTSMEMYCFVPNIVEKVLYVLAGGTTRSGVEVLQAIKPLLKIMFLYRAANHLLKYGLHWIEICRCCSLSGHAIQFDEKDYQYRYFNTRGLTTEQKSQFIKRIVELEQIPCPDERNCIRGHDFVEVLAWYLGRVEGASPAPRSADVSRLLYSALSAGDLSRERLFSELVRRTSSTAAALQRH